MHQDEPVREMSDEYENILEAPASEDGSKFDKDEPVEGEVVEDKK